MNVRLTLASGTVIFDAAKLAEFADAVNAALASADARIVKEKWVGDIRTYIATDPAVIEASIVIELVKA